MALRTIRIQGDPVLTNKCKEIKEVTPKIRELIFSGEISKAEQLMLLAMSGCPNSVHPYQTLGDIHINFMGIQDVSDYKRQLDLEKALCTITFHA